jgi:hypothetical protein
MKNVFIAVFVATLALGGLCSSLRSAQPADQEKPTIALPNETDAFEKATEQVRRKYEEAKEQSEVEQLIQKYLMSQLKGKGVLAEELEAAGRVKIDRGATEHAEAAQAMIQQLQAMKLQLEVRERQLAAMAEQMAARERQSNLPPLEGAQVKVYPLRFAKAREAAQTIDNLFGAQALRVAVDEQSNSLVVYGKSDSIAAVDTLLQRLDAQPDSNAGGDSSNKEAAAPRTLVVRLFWLADGLPEGEGQQPVDFLPQSVVDALQKLGLEAPRLVTQTVSSLAIGDDEPVRFSTHVPAVLLKGQSMLSVHGELRAAQGDRVAMEINLNIQGAANCELQGSLATPLGHYMVLGTANSVINTATTVPAGGEMMGGGRGGYGPDMGIEGPAVPGEGMMGAEPAEPNFRTSRFAFVVQVVEGESFPAENTK